MLCYICCYHISSPGKTFPFLYLSLLALQLHDSHLKISSVLCSSTRFVFPVRSSSCKAAGSASGIRISFNSLQLKSTICSRKKKKHDDKEHSLFFHVISYQLFQCSVLTSDNPTTDCIPQTAHENDDDL